MLNQARVDSQDGDDGVFVKELLDGPVTSHMSQNCSRNFHQKLVVCQQELDVRPSLGRKNVEDVRSAREELAEDPAGQGG